MGVRFPVSTLVILKPSSVTQIICFAALGSVATAFIATLGPRTGLRTMIISRYSSGYLGCMFFSILNIITQYVFFSMDAISPVDTWILGLASLR